MKNIEKYAKSPQAKSLEKKMVDKAKDPKTKAKGPFSQPGPPPERDQQKPRNTRGTGNLSPLSCLV